MVWVGRNQPPTFHTKDSVMLNPTPQAAASILLTEKHLARRWNTSVKYVQKLRYAGGGPEYLKLGRMVRYDLEEVIKWEQRQARAHTSDPGNSR